MPENYHNVKALLQELGTHYFTYIIGDNKILRMIYGMQSCSATFACVWCDFFALVLNPDERDYADEIT